MHRRTCLFSGHVQGVGFRYTAQGIAARHNVTGYVRNLDDGRVELVIEGPEGEMDQVLDEIQDRMGEYIRDVDMNEQPATGEFRGFGIRH